MSDFPESTSGEPVSRPPDEATSPGAHSLSLSGADQPSAPAPIFVEARQASFESPTAESPMFQSWQQPEIRPTVRIPNFGHLALLIPLLGLGFIAGIILFLAGVHVHLFGVTSLQQAGTDIHFILGMEGVIYLCTFAAAALVFPVFWHKSLMAGLQWNGATALRLRGRLISAAFVCFLLAWLNGVLIPGPTNTPIEKVFRTPGAAWLLFGFGVTFAPFFEEMFFRGFLLPCLCTVCDWTDESIFARPNLRISTAGRVSLSTAAMVIVSTATVGVPAALIYAVVLRSPVLFLVCLPLGPALYLGLNSIRSPQANQSIRPLDEKGHPQWSLNAMIVGSIATSIPFAWMHAEQTGYSLGPFLLLVGVSLVLCAVRLSTRSLASSVMVHACYNLLLFSLMLVATGGFRHLDKM